MGGPPRRSLRTTPAFVKRSFLAAKPFIRSIDPSNPKRTTTLASETPQATSRLPLLSNAKVALPASLEPLDLPPAQISLPCLREVFLSDLSELETRLSQLDDTASTLPSDLLEEGAAFVREGLEFLDWLMSEVGTHMHMPDFDFDFDFELRSKLPDLPDFDFDVKSKLSATLDEARSRFGHLDLTLPSLPDTKEYRNALRSRLSAMRGRLQAMSLSNAGDLYFPSLSPPKALVDLLPDLLGEEDDQEPLTPLSERLQELIKATTASCNGRHLISYEHLPAKWKNNEFVLHGYR